MPPDAEQMLEGQDAREFDGASRPYPSKRDWWIVLIVWGTIAMTILAGVKAAQSAFASLAGLAFVLFCAAVVLGLLTILYATYYIIIGDRLIAHCGPFKQSVLLQDIEEVVPSHSPLSSPALSLDRLHVRCRGSIFGLLISPRDKQGFLADLVARAPQLRIDGDRAVSGGHQ
jgi:hypothetical protein